MNFTQKLPANGFIEVSKLLHEMEKELPSKTALNRTVNKPFGKQAILEVLARAADDDKFLAQMAENPAKALEVYNLNWQEKAALSSGDLQLIESWVGKLDKRLSTWIWCRLQQEKW